MSYFSTEINQGNIGVHRHQKIQNSLVNWSMQSKQKDITLVYIYIGDFIQLGSYYQWNEEFGNLDLWYAHYDNQPNFNDFNPFGGWNRPAWKQYSGDQILCDLDVDYDYQSSMMS